MSNLIVAFLRHRLPWIVAGLVALGAVYIAWRWDDHLPLFLNLELDEAALVPLRDPATHVTHSVQAPYAPCAEPAALAVQPRSATDVACGAPPLKPKESGVVPLRPR